MKKVEIIQVWRHNLAVEFARIRSAVSVFPFISIDTEFPGTIIQSDLPIHSQPPEFKYKLMKANVDATHIIQLGLTLSDRNGNLPDFGTDTSCIWEFNFSDFDVDSDPQNPDSIILLKQQGIDFVANKKKGIPSFEFAFLMRYSGLLSNRSRLTWVTFHGAYDFGFLVKILNQKPLPEDIGSFMGMMMNYFGQRVYDIKHMIGFCEGVFGGLEKVAKTLEVDRVAGKSHQAGSDSLLTLQTFMKLEDDYEVDLDQFQGVLYGLEIEIRRIPVPVAVHVVRTVGYPHCSVMSRVPGYTHNVVCLPQCPRPAYVVGLTGSGHHLNGYPVTLRG